MQSVLITGASSGFGRLTAETLAKKGYTVFAGMREITGRNAATAKELEGSARAGNHALHAVEIDVTDDASVRAAVERAIGIAGKLDVVVNNAGLLTAGLGEAFTDDQFRQVFEANVLGPQRVVRAVLPSMRAQGAGLLVWVSSSMAHIGYPYISVYSASKKALEGLAETYRYELAPLGIDSVIVVPGGFPTGMVSKMMEPSDVERLEGYGDLARAPRKFMQDFDAMMSGPNGPNPQDVADAIAKVIETPLGQRPLRILIDHYTGDGLKAINETMSTTQERVFSAFGMSSLLNVKPGAS
jgi:NAD(P)-dependent dehydrogenase (short-subunit alcohol dehydrogenase family)